jgi:hypothetical protein
MDTYLSPLYFLPQGTGLGDLHSDQILLAKKKLLAETELSPDKTIVLNKMVCTRNDVLNLFDKLIDHGEELNYHFAIFRNKILLEFLENRFVAVLPVSLESDLKNDPGFIDFISPYFEKVYTPLFIKCIKQHRIVVISTLMANSYLMNYADRNRPYKAAYNLINKYTEQIINHTQKIKAQIRINLFYPFSIFNLLNFLIPKNYKISEFKQYYDSTFIAVLNVLPEQFDDLRTEYCRVVMNMGIGLQRHDLKLALKILKNISSLKCSDYMHQKVEDNHRIMSPKFSSRRIFRYVILALLILRLIQYIRLYF